MGYIRKSPKKAVVDGEDKHPYMKGYIFWRNCRFWEGREDMTEKGWIKEGEFYVEQNIKGRDKIWVNFESHYFRIYHGENRTFIALERSKKWFEVYYLMAHGDNGRFNLAGV